ncbi:hypothetical protein RND81_11G234800 [Saponaria officinalis]|uniref:BZIP domain-containing protein n=1 Tax=Saponaria officinalis TaxID=3572 RepID=A0AAW1HQX9_SAPOF
MLTSTDSSSSTSSSSPFSHTILHNNKSMYQIWNNNNNNNNNNVVHHPTATTNFRGMILQDFLNCNTQSITAVDHHDHHHPTTALKLTNEFHQLFESNNIQCAQNYSAFDVLASNSMLSPFGGGGGGGGDAVVRKRSSESTPENVTVDRRHKRMIKNRESAARSRARKELLEAASTQVAKKKGLHRTLTAPF